MSDIDVECVAHGRTECPLCVDDAEPSTNMDELMEQNEYLRKRYEMARKALDDLGDVRQELSDARDEIDRLNTEIRNMRMSPGGGIEGPQ